MAAPGECVQLGHGLDDLCPNGIQMDVPDKGKEIVVFVAEYGFIPVLKKVPFFQMFAIEILCVPGEKFSHDSRDANLSAPKQKVNMVVHEHPCINGALRFLNGFSQALKKSGFIIGITEDVSPVGSPGS